jgi:rhodanese-related sulfurtransferase
MLIYLIGGIDMFSFFKKNYDSVSASDLGEKQGKINLIDVRERYEYKAGHIPNAKNVPMGELLEDPEKYLSKDREYHVVCASGARSSRTCGRLSSLGYQVVNVAGGTMSYGKPLKR